MANNGPICGTCKFWHHDQMAVLEGECRRFPPRNFLLGVVDTAAGQQPAFTSAFPRIRSSLGCGEHKQKIELHS